MRTADGPFPMETTYMWQPGATFLTDALPVDDYSQDAVLSVHNLYFWPKPEATIAEIARVLRPGGRVLVVFRGREHPLPKRLDPAVYQDVSTDQCLAWLASAVLEGHCRHLDGVPPEVSFVLATSSS